MISTSHRLKRIAEPKGTDRSASPALPTFRGRSHQIAFPFAVIGTVAMIIRAQTIPGQVAGAIYGLSLAGLLLSSALYNRLLGTPKIRPWMRWFDHSMIYVLIAGSYTPTGVVTLPRRVGTAVLAVVWSGAILGILTKLIWKERARVIGAILYLAIGWAAVAAAPPLISALPPVASVFFIAGGVLYMSGAMTLYFKRPNPRPATFGYHEVWHLYVVGAAACHFIGNWVALTV
jgi:hemolysin III